METLRNLDKVNERKSYFSYFIVILAFLFAVFVYVSSEQKVEEARQQAYILKNDGEIFVGEVAKVRDNREVEVKHHLKMLHNALFFLQPDEDLINKQIKETAFYLGDNSIVEFHKRRINSDFYNDIIRTGSVVEFRMDSIKVNLEAYPYYAVCWGRQRIIREQEIIYHSVITKNYLSNTIRKEKNPHGLSDNFKMIEYSEISRKNR